VLLAEQAFVVVYQHVSKLELEAAGVRAAQANADCPECNGGGTGIQLKDFRFAGCGYSRNAVALALMGSTLFVQTRMLLASPNL
jgi:hypothetical protein